jgi:sporulation protein YtfJ
MSENNHPINEVLQTTMNKIREMVDASTVVGQPIVTQEGITLIPVSKISLGFATGGTDFGKSQNVPKNFGGGAGAGVNVVPVGFLIVKEGNVRLLPVAPPASDTAGRVVELVPEMFDKVTDYIDKKTADKKNAENDSL